MKRVLTLCILLALSCSTVYAQISLSDLNIQRLRDSKAAETIEFLHHALALEGGGNSAEAILRNQFNQGHISPLTYYTMDALMMTAIDQQRYIEALLTEERITQEDSFFIEDNLFIAGLINQVRINTQSRSGLSRDNLILVQGNLHLSMYCIYLADLLNEEADAWYNLAQAYAYLILRGFEGSVCDVPFDTIQFLNLPSNPNPISPINPSGS